MLFAAACRGEFFCFSVRYGPQPVPERGEKINDAQERFFAQRSGRAGGSATAVCAGHVGAAGGHVQGVCRTVLLTGRVVYGNQRGGNPAQGPV